jgi:hypothetical protein
MSVQPPSAEEKVSHSAVETPLPGASVPNRSEGSSVTDNSVAAIEVKQSPKKQEKQPLPDPDTRSEERRVGKSV